MDIKDEQEKVQGTYPNGKLNENDAGSLMIAIGVEKDSVVLRFAESTDWIGMPPETAVTIAQELIRRAREIGFKGPVSIEI